MIQRRQQTGGTSYNWPNKSAETQLDVKLEQNKGNHSTNSNQTRSMSKYLYYSEFIVIVGISQVYIEKHLGISAGKLILTLAFVPAAELYTRSILHHGFPCMDYFYDSLKRTYNGN